LRSDFSVRNNIKWQLDPSYEIDINVPMLSEFIGEARDQPALGGHSIFNRFSPAAILMHPRGIIEMSKLADGDCAKTFADSIRATLLASS